MDLTFAVAMLGIVGTLSGSAITGWFGRANLRRQLEHTEVMAEHAEATRDSQWLRDRRCAAFAELLCHVDEVLELNVNDTIALEYATRPFADSEARERVYARMARSASVVELLGPVEVVEQAVAVSRELAELSRAIRSSDKERVRTIHARAHQLRQDLTSTMSEVLRR